MKSNTEQKNPRTASGKIISDKMDKSIVVLVERKVKHEKYGKYIKLSNKIHAHDEENKGKIGDHVRICESRPYSKTKSWKLLDIVETAEQ